MEQAVLAADPERIVKENLKLEGHLLRVRSLRFDLSRFRRVIVLGGGKATGKMAIATEAVLGDFVTGGLVNVPDYQRFRRRSSRIAFNEATHPFPSPGGVRGARKMLRLVGHASGDDLVICLVSGGGSSLLPLPAKGVTLADKTEVTRLLLRSGADIHEMNAVRKHLSSVKGGRLARLLYPATVLSLIISDVTGDRVDSVGSGLTAPDPTTYSDAKEVLVRKNLWTQVSGRVRSVLEKGVRGELEETPKAGDRAFRRVHNVVIGSNRLSRAKAAEELTRLGYRTVIVPGDMVGEARKAGSDLAARLVALRSGSSGKTLPCALVAGGETVVKVARGGVGGRNQELVLSATMAIQGLQGVAIASIGTDGIDGPTDAAGAIADGQTFGQGRRMGLDAGAFLENNDSYSFFKELGDLIFTGPTGTNVNDITVGAVRRLKVRRSG